MTDGITNIARIEIPSDDPVFAKVLNRERVRFELAGGNYRLVTAFDFQRQIAFVKAAFDLLPSRCNRESCQDRASLSEGHSRFAG